jgi:DNA-binding GntR family transcriptional regulator
MLSMTIKLNRSPLYEKAYEAVLGMILGGRLQPGQRVTENWLAELLGVSSTPVREAMRKLEHDGLLESEGNTFRVVVLSAEDIEHLYACREALEALAIEAAVERLDEADLEELEAILEAAERAAEREDFLELVQIHTRFHNTFIRATGNRWLESTLNFVRRPLLLYRIQVYLEKLELQRILDDHRALFQAVKQRDSKAALDLLCRHMRSDCEGMCREVAHRQRDEVK